jgi:hypothetical protein
VDVESATALKGRPESVAWNEFRRQWIALAAHQPGEVWFAAADTPVGPWGYARRVAVHGDYNFYNLAQHSFFDQEGGRLVYFEGTYTDSFSAARTRTPRYNYNQIMYRLDLSDPRLQLPVAIYRVRDSRGMVRLGAAREVSEWEGRERVEEVAFFALPSNAGSDDTVAVYAAERNGFTELSLTPPEREARPVFVALPAVPPLPGATADGVWHCRSRQEGEPGDGVSFSLELKHENGRVRVKRPDGTMSAHEGRLVDQRLTLRLEVDGALFDCEAKLEPGRMAGTWVRVGTADRGSWSGTLVDVTPAEWKSAALVPLQLFQRNATGERFYATAADVPEGARPLGAPLCRVWKSPGALTSFDWKATLVPAAESR